MNAIYTMGIGPTMAVVARLNKKLKSFRVTRAAASLVEQTAKDLKMSEGDIIDYCILNNIEGVVDRALRSGSAVGGTEAFLEFKTRLAEARKNTESDKPANGKSGGTRRKK